LKSLLEQLLLAAVGTLVRETPDATVVAVERTRDAAHGDYVSKVAMRLAKATGKNPRELAQAIVDALPASALVAKAEVAGAGFINFFLRPDALAYEIRRIHELGETYGRSVAGAGKRVYIGVVTESPTSPLDVTRGRQAAHIEVLVNVLSAAGYDVHRDASFELPLVRNVTLHRASGPVKVTSSRQLCDEVGHDASRFFLLMRSHEQPLDFDLELAKTRTNENPLYYVQYVHARASSVMKEVTARGFSFDLAAGLDQLGLLNNRSEQALITTLLRFPDEVEEAAANCAPHAIVYYLRDMATTFHTYYNAEKWIVEETDLRNARLALVLAARQVIRNGLALLGVSAPESM
jgi:arginyl-tRNA synthetase